MLASESGRRESFPEDLQMRLHKLIGEILERDKAKDIKNDPKSFLASFEWASDNAYPEIVALTEEVITGGGLWPLPPQHRDLAKFLEDAPWMRKWVHQCALCHQQGYKPEMRESDSYNTPVGSKLTRLVNKMFLNDAGVCEACCTISDPVD